MANHSSPFLDALITGTSRSMAATGRLLPLPALSHMFAFLARNIGPLLPSDRRAKRNLHFIWPGLPKARSRQIRRQMYDNLAFLGAEYIHSDRLTTSSVLAEVTGAEHLQAALTKGKGVLLVTAHFGNWEAIRIAAAQHGPPPGLLYRSFDTKGFDRLALERLGYLEGAPIAHKGRRGTLTLLRKIRQGGVMMLLMDQRSGGGPPIPFLGQPAETSTSVADIMLNYQAEVITAVAFRIKRSNRFRVVFEPPIPRPDAPEANTSATDIMRVINDRMSAWIEEAPGQWFWLHRRWGKNLPIRQLAPGSSGR